MKPLEFIIVEGLKECGIAIENGAVSGVGAANMQAAPVMSNHQPGQVGAGGLAAPAAAAAPVGVPHPAPHPAFPIGRPLASSSLATSFPDQMSVVRPTTSAESSAEVQKTLLTSLADLQQKVNGFIENKDQPLPLVVTKQ